MWCWVDDHEPDPIRAPLRLRWPGYDRPEQDRGRGDSTFDAFPAALWATLALAFAAAVLFAVARARRLGPPVAEPLPVLVPSAEAVTGRGRLYHRIGARQATLDALRTAAIVRLTRVLNPYGGAAAERELTGRGDTTPATEEFIARVAAAHRRAGAFRPRDPLRTAAGERRPAIPRNRPARRPRGRGPPGHRADLDANPRTAFPATTPRRNTVTETAEILGAGEPSPAVPHAATDPAEAAARAALGQLRTEIGKAVVGQDATVTGLVIALLCRGHVLLEGVPGVAKTLLVRTLAAPCRSTRNAYSSRPTSCRATSPARSSSTPAPRRSSSARARSSRTCCSPTRSTALRRRPRHRCWR